MKKTTLTCVSLLALGLSSSLFAQPKGSGDAGRQKAQCEANVDVCDGSARDDYNACKQTPNTNCDDNYYEDINQCTSDYNACLGSIAVKGAATSIVIGTVHASQAKGN